MTDKELGSRPIFLRGQLVNLRPLLEADLPLFLRWINDEETRQWLATYLPMMEADEQDWLERVRKGKPGEITMVIEEATSRQAIGAMGIHRIDWRARVATTGALIGEREFRGKGYGPEAKLLLLNYAFNTLNLRKICSEVISGNERSLKYSLKCGYHEEGRRRGHYFAKGEYRDQILLAIFAEDFSPIWENYLASRKIA